MSGRCARGATGGAAARVPPLLSGKGRRVGGRFWAFADADEEEADGDADGAPPSPPTPTPSDYVNDWFNAGYTEEEVASSIDEVLPPHDPSRIGLRTDDKREMVRRLVHRRLSSAAVKTWKGPLPKVLFQATALIRMWSLLTPTEARERLVTGSLRWEMIARDIFNRFGWRSCNRIGD